jgi:hypothetical protein
MEFGASKLNHKQQRARSVAVTHCKLDPFCAVDRTINAYSAAGS